MANLNTIRVEVAYAKADEQLIIPLEVPQGTNVQQAIEKSNILRLFSEIDLTQNKVGIFSKICMLTTLLREGDRIEIYRSLIADPKKIRQQRAQQGKVLKKGSNK
jgi:putative ubiquitin-RnfH superfamily antitoxin RatB of RatAB toxin-antitoxin module